MGRINGGGVEAPVDSIRGVARGDSFGGCVGGSLVGPNENAVIVTPTRIHPEICRTVSDRRCGPAKTVGAGADAVVKRVKEESVGVPDGVVVTTIGAGKLVEVTGGDTCPVGSPVCTDHQQTWSVISTDHKDLITVTDRGQVLANWRRSFCPVGFVNTIPHVSRCASDNVCTRSVASIVDPKPHIRRIGHRSPAKAIVTYRHASQIFSVGNGKHPRLIPGGCIRADVPQGPLIRRRK